MYKITFYLMLMPVNFHKRHKITVDVELSQNTSVIKMNKEM